MTTDTLDVRGREGELVPPSSTAGESNRLGFVPQKRGPRRLALPLACVFVGLLLGVAIMSLGATIWVTPSVVILQSGGHNATSSSNCDGWPQVSFDGYFECSVVITNTASASSDSLVFVENVTAPAATNLVVYPQAITVFPGTSGTVHISGQLGYSGDVTVYVGVYN